MAEQLVQQINEAIGAHGMWKMRLKTAIRTAQSEISPATASCSDQCAFGKWLEGSELSPAVKSGTPYAVIKRLHAEFHRSAGAVLGQALSGRKSEAEAAMDGEFAEKTDKLVRALTKWKREVSS